MRTSLLLASALLTGCVDVGRPFARGSRRAVVQGRAEAEAAEARRVASLPRVPRDQQSGYRVFEAEGEVAHEALGPLRFDRRGLTFHTAEEVPARPIVFAQRAARGWVFVTDRDEVYVSPTFTGPLRAVRTLGCPAQEAPPPTPTPTPPPTAPPTPAETPAERAARAAAEAMAAAEFPGLGDDGWPVGGPSRGLMHAPPDTTPVAWRSVGRVSFSIRGRALWSDGVVVREEGAPGVVALAWKGEAHGARIVAHRTLEVTHDGGARWRVVPLEGALPLEVVGAEEALQVVTTRGAIELRDDGSTAPASASTREAQPHVPSARGRPGCDVVDTILSAAQARFARGYTRVAPARPECVEAPAGGAWEMGRVVAHLPTSGGVDAMPEWAVPRGRPAPLGSPRARAFIDTRAASAVVSATRPDHATRGHPITLAWRGGDFRGAFSSRVATTAPREIPETSPWRLVTATRAGLVVKAEARAEGEPEGERTRDDLYWFGAAGARRLGLSLAEEQGVQGIALEDGGAIVLAQPDLPPRYPDRCARMRWFAPPERAVALRLDAAGNELARREVVTGDDFQPLVGVGQRGDRWGVVVGGGELTWLPLDGGEEPFGRWSMEGEPVACGASSPDRLHLLDGATDGDEALPVTVGPQGDGPDFAQVRLVTLERDGGGVCVRRLWGVQHLDSYREGGEDFGERYGAARFEARGGGMEGTFDDGRSIARVSATLGARVGFLQDI